MNRHNRFWLLAGVVVPSLASSIASAQVTVGYNSVTSVVGAAIIDHTYKQRVTDQYAITGVNVEPTDGSNVFDRRTIWKIMDQSQPWALTVREDTPSVDVNTIDMDSKLVQAGRRETVYAVVSAPLSGVIDRRTMSPFASVVLPAVIPSSTTVFP